MFLKITYALLTLISVASFSAVASIAGGTSGGGGGAFVCRNGQGQITSSELLDLWEAAKIEKQNIVRSNDEIEAQMEKAISKLDRVQPKLAEEIRLELKTILANAQVLSLDVDLPVPSDANIKYQKPGCPLEGMMFFDGDLDAVVYKEQTYNNLLSSTDKAAIWVHEAIYKIMRERFKNINSINTRKLVGCLFSTDCRLSDSLMTIDELLKNNKDSVIFQCSDSTSEFYVTGYIDHTEYINGIPQTVTRDVFHYVGSYIVKLLNNNFQYPATQKVVTSISPYYNTVVYQGFLEKYGIYVAPGGVDMGSPEIDEDGNYTNHYKYGINWVSNNTRVPCKRYR